MRIIRTIKTVHKIIKASNEKLKKAEIIEKSNGLITDSIYNKYECNVMSKKELNELIEQLKFQKQKNNEMSKWYINVVCEKTGWDYQKARSEMNKALKKGYSFRQYITKSAYLISGELPKIDKQIFKKEAAYRKKEIMEEMKWSSSKYELEFFKARNNCGCNSREFCIFKLYKKSPEDQLKYITLRSHLQMHIRYIDYASGFEIFNDKVKFNERFNSFVSRVWFGNEKLTFEDFCKKTKELDAIIYKPSTQQAGKGILKFEITNDKEKMKETYDYIISNGPAIIEEFLTQHEKMSNLYPNSVNTIRVMTIVKDGECLFLNSALRMGKNKYVDNFCAGGISAGIDIKTGKVETNGVDNDGNIFTHHPSTGTKIEGFEIPYWNKILKTVKDAALSMPTSPYIGWDICILENGDIELIEGNPDQYATFFQYIYAADKDKGIKHTIEPYIEFNNK